MHKKNASHFLYCKERKVYKFPYNEKRFWEVDCLRGIAIILMIISNFATDLFYFRLYNSFSGFWYIFARITASVFIFLVGVSLYLSFCKGKRLQESILEKFVLRGFKVFSLGLFITLVTWLMMENGFIFFGVLHFIGVASILAVPFLDAGKKNIFFGLLFIAAGLIFGNFVFDFSWLLWLGFIPAGFYTVDFFPVFPWFGLVLIGLYFGKKFYLNGKRKFELEKIDSKIIDVLGFLGRNSLKIYLIHQPVLIGLLYLFVL